MEQIGPRSPSPFVVKATASVILGLAAAAGVWALAERQPASQVEEPRGAQQFVAKPAAASRSAPRPDRVAPASLCATCGVVESVRALDAQGDAANVPGGQAAPGNAAPLDGNPVYRVTIRMDDGSRRTISQPRAPGYGVGEKVHIIESPVEHG